MRLMCLLMLSGIMALVLLGCSSGEDQQSFTPATRGAATFTIVWPDATKLIPAATNSVVVSLSDADGFANTQMVNRPLEGSFSTITFSELPVKQLAVSIAAYPQADAQGVAVATGQSVVDIIANATATVTVKLNSTIDHLSISPTDPTINIDQTVDLGVAAADADGNTVLLTAGKISWASSDASVATVDSVTGLVTALHDGTAIITVTDAESLQTATTLVTVRKRPTLTLTADSTAILYGAKTTLRWTATDADTVVSSNFDATTTSGTAEVSTLTEKTYTLTVSGPGGQASASVTVTVATVSVAITPAPDPVSVQKSATYAVTVTGAADDAVTWSIDANGGTITPNGHQCVYTAPATHGTYHLTATSVADPTKSDTIAITVQSGSADVVIQ